MSLHGRIYQHVLERPEQIAIQYGARKMSYQQLEEESNRLAHFFMSKGVVGARVLVLCKRSPELVVSLLGILKSGNVFVPLDPNYPDLRLQVMVEEAQAEWVVLERAGFWRIAPLVEGAGQTLKALLLSPSAEVDAEVRAFDQPLQLHRLPAGSAPDYDYTQEVAKNCYLYFTSGSTGRPKGVLGRHRSLEHFIDWEIREFGVQETFRCSQLTSPSFDPFLRDVLVPLCAGGTLCIPDDDAILYNPLRLSQWIREQRVTLMHLTPSLFKPLAEVWEMEEVWADLRYILLAGEKLRGNDLKKVLLRAPEALQLVNLYGPTETTLAKFFYRIQRDDLQKNTIPVGKPLPQTEVLILNQYGEICQTGDVGEVYIRTPFISSGYYNRPELTREVFIQNPFHANPRDLLYKTGDLGRMAPDGNLELMGRVDQQVKIRGIRIEPGEIENHLLGHGEIREAVVTVVDTGSGEQELVAYYTAESRLPYGELRNYLLQGLPQHMLPGYLVWLPEMPMLPNGKVNKNALPAVDNTNRQIGTYIAPATELEAKLAAIWAEVLRVERVGVEDHFYEIGGHSLKAIALIGKIEQSFGVALAPEDIFTCATVRQMARLLELAEQSGYQSPAAQGGRSAVRAFNVAREKKIFCFPPIAGYGITYQSFAEALTGYAVYAFDFLEMENRMEEYIRLMREIEPDGPYLLLGYSAGGSLAFQVAKAMEEQGLAVSGVILLDSALNAEAQSLSPEAIERMVETMIEREQNERIREALALAGVREAVKRKIASYLQYRAATVDTGTVRAVLYYVASAQGTEKAMLWQHVATQPLQVLTGHGSHEMMLEPQYLLRNVEVIERICREIWGE